MAKKRKALTCFGVRIPTKYCSLCGDEIDKNGVYNILKDNYFCINCIGEGVLYASPWLHGLSREN